MTEYRFDELQDLNSEIIRIRSQINQLDNRIENSLTPSVIDIAERNSLQRDLLRLLNINPKYVRIKGRFRISNEVNDYEMYVTFRGLDFDYYALADTALNIYFEGIVSIETTGIEVIAIAEDQLVDWADKIFDLFPEQPQNIAVFEMNQIVPTARIKEVSEITGKEYSRGIRKGSRRFVNLNTGEFDFA
jgi:hypothetical protein